MMHDAPNLADAKAALRRSILAERSSRPEQVRAERDRRRTELIVDFVHQVGARTVASYLSRAPEPDTLDLVAQLYADRVQVLVPVLSAPNDTPISTPQWADYAGAERLRCGRWGIPEPNTPSKGPSALAAADVVICSALAVDGEGNRLGVGGGWHDRALTQARPDAILLAAVFDEEVVEAVPHGTHDIPVHVVASPSGLIEVAR